MAGEKRGGLEITTPRTAPGAARPRAPGEVIFDLVFSNESLWGTVDPHGAQTLVEKSVAEKGVVDLGDLMREFVDRKTKPDLARGTVLAFAMELARAGVAIRLPAELQSLDRTARQKLVDVFRAGQKTADEPTKTLAQPSSSAPRIGSNPSRPPAARSASSSVPSPSSTPPRASSPPSRPTTTTERTDQALDGWSQGLGAATEQRAPAKGKVASKAGPQESSNPGRPARAPTEAGRERSRTNIERPRPAERLAIGALFGPGRIAVMVATLVFLVVGIVFGPRGSVVVPADEAFPSDIPCLRVDKNGPHAFCIVNLEAVKSEMTLDDIDAKKAAMLASARNRGFTSLTFYNPDLTRWDPIPAAVRPPAAAVARRPVGGGVAAGNEQGPAPSFADYSTTAEGDSEEGAPVEAPYGGGPKGGADGEEEEPRDDRNSDSNERGELNSSGSASSDSSRGRAQVIQPAGASSSSSSTKNSSSSSAKKKKR